MKQRQLTQEELNLAPEWAIEYDNSNAHLLFISEKIGVYRGDEIYKFYDVNDDEVFIKTKGSSYHMAQPIPRKAFDLSEVVWSDFDVKVIRLHDGVLVSTLKKPVKVIQETKQDIINKAKALGVKPEDLK